jgi:hypothetical protein
VAFLQAVADDSASDVGDRRLFLAGFMNSAEKWRLFCDAWDDELKAGRPISYLRMTEANSFRGQFRGWTKAQRDEKLRGFARVARHFKPISFHVSISRAQNSNVLTPTAPRGVANPHFLCCFAIAAMLSRYIFSQDASLPVEFIFDQQNGVDDDMGLFFDYMKANLPQEAANLISNKPIFRDDKQWFPLQAADMLAWHLRKNHEVRGAWHLDSSEPLYNPEGHLHMELDQSLQDWADEFAKLPGIDKMQSRSEWRKLKREIRRLTAAGFIPPYGSRLKNFLYALRAKLAKLAGLS